MKTKEQKYREAVERNLKGLCVSPYRDAPLAVCRTKLGIRKGDTTWDQRIFEQRGRENET